MSEQGSVRKYTVVFDGDKIIGIEDGGTVMDGEAIQTDTILTRLAVLADGPEQALNIARVRKRYFFGGEPTCQNSKDPDTLQTLLRFDQD